MFFFSGMYDLLKNEYGKYDIDTINLTSVLQKSAQMNLKNDKLIFWQDDTHWNKLGIKSAMQALISEIN